MWGQKSNITVMYIFLKQSGGGVVFLLERPHNATREFAQSFPFGIFEVRFIMKIIIIIIIISQFLSQPSFTH